MLSKEDIKMLRDNGFSDETIESVGTVLEIPNMIVTYRGCGKLAMMSFIGKIYTTTDLIILTECPNCDKSFRCLTHNIYCFEKKDCWFRKICLAKAIEKLGIGFARAEFLKEPKQGTTQTTIIDEL